MGLEFAIEGVQGAHGLGDEALIALQGNTPDLQSAFNAVRFGRGQCGFTRGTIQDAVDRDELNVGRARRAQAEVAVAQQRLASCRHFG